MGRIYALENHGWTVYLTWRQHLFLNLLGWIGGVGGALAFILAFLFADRRPKRSSNKNDETFDVSLQLIGIAAFLLSLIATVLRW